MTIESTMALGRDWAGEDVRGWIASEKFDGVRLRWDGWSAWTRSGKHIELPASMVAPLPLEPLDLEVWCGYGGFLRAREAANHGHWLHDVRLVIFDAPDRPGDHADRMVWQWPSHLMTVSPRYISGIDEAREMMDAVHARGGEGVVLRPPVRRYVTGRGGFLKLTR